MRENVWRSLKLLIDAHPSSGKYPSDKLCKCAWRPSLYRLTRIIYNWGYQGLMNIFINASQSLGEVYSRLLKGLFTFKRYILRLMIFFGLFIMLLRRRLSWRRIICSGSIFLRSRCSQFINCRCKILVLTE